MCAGGRRHSQWVLDSRDHLGDLEFLGHPAEKTHERGKFNASAKQWPAMMDAWALLVANGPSGYKSKQQLLTMQIYNDIAAHCHYIYCICPLYNTALGL